MFKESLHCLSLYLTPIQADNGPNAPHSSSTGIKSVELEIQLPQTQNEILVEINNY